MHFFAGFSGTLTGVLILLSIGLLACFSKKQAAYNLDPLGAKGAFEPLLVKYLRAAEFFIGLATASIVLLVGSSAFNGHGRLPWFYASPLLLLAMCVLYGVVFMVWLIFSYEDYQHGNPHTARNYAVSETLGFSSLACFCIGYIWLVLAVVR